MRDVAVGRDHGRRQPDRARGGLDGRRPHRLVREADPRRRDAAEHARVPEADRGRRGGDGRRRHPRSRPGRPFLRRRPHARALSTRLLRADAVRLAQLPDLGECRRQDRHRARQRDLEGTAAQLRSAADGRRPQGRARRLRGEAQGRDSRPARWCRTRSSNLATILRRRRRSRHDGWRSDVETDSDQCHAAIVRVRHYGVVRLFYPRARLWGGVRLRRAALLCTGHP